eukprot:Phypoly_transcript_11826.p1 GENE.Phypoly_transcript_11826~~Phypoly_transcript_11826.p1  ORF type:complete len:313 (+),score=12.17 Phypoly_transcript_11826:71-1009(+)
MDLVEVEYNVTAPFCLFSAIICAIAIITSYIFPQQRKFPNVVLVWTCIIDFVFAVYISMLLLPGPVRTYFANQIPYKSAYCTLSMYTLWAIQEAASMLSLLLACMLYLRIVKQLSMRETRTYYYGFIIAFWIPTISLPMFSILEKMPRAGVGYCDTRSKLGVGFRAGSWLFSLFIQVILLTRVFMVVQKMTRDAKRSSSRPSMSKAKLWLYLGCIGAQVHRVIVWFPTILVELIPLWNGVPGPGLIMAATITPCLLFLNGLIVLAGNKPLKRVILNFCAKLCQWNSGNKNSMKSVFVRLPSLRSMNPGRGVA